MRNSWVLVLFCLLGACANPYEQFYQGSHNLADARAIPTYDTSVSGVQIYSTNDFDRDVRALVQRGYAVVGQASFNAGADAISEANVRAQAEKVGAHVVLVSSQYSHTVSGAIPLTVPQTQTSHTTGTATAYGQYGSVTAYGNATTTTYGSQTVMMPYSVARYDAGAVFLAKYKPRLGIIPVALSDEVRMARGSNQGVQVEIVMQESPAFIAGVLPGDIVLSANSQPLFSPEALTSIVMSPEVKTVKLGIVRDAKPITIDVTLTQFPPKPAVINKE